MVCQNQNGKSDVTGRTLCESGNEVAGKHLQRVHLLGDHSHKQLLSKCFTQAVDTNIYTVECHTELSLTLLPAEYDAHNKSA